MPTLVPVETHQELGMDMLYIGAIVALWLVTRAAVAGCAKLQVRS